MYKKLVFFSLFLSFSIIVVAAQPVPIEEEVSRGAQKVSCFDYYTFGSVDVNLISNYDSYEPGDPVIITGVINNNNQYPVVGLTIKARLVKDIPNPEPTRAEIMILDEFDIANNITLDANGEFPVSYTHLLPLNAPAGQYQIYFYAVEQDRFNLAGLSFTNDIVASRIGFEVRGGQPEHIYLDQTRIIVGNQPHNVMAFMTQHAPSVEVPLSIPLVNPTTIPKQMTVTYTLYSWDAANPANQIRTYAEQVTVLPQSEKILTYILEEGELPVYYLSITAEPTNKTSDVSVFKEKTLSNIRFVIQDRAKPRLNFVGVDSFPLKKGVASTLITCFHNTNTNRDTQDTTIQTVVLDNKNRELSRTEYRGKVPPDIEGLKNTFIPKKDIGEFTVIAKIIGENGNEIDTVVKKYNCGDINLNMCPPPETITQQMIWGIMGMIVCLGIIIIVTWKRKNKHIQ